MKLQSLVLGGALVAILFSGVVKAEPGNPQRDLASHQPLGPTRIAVTIDDLPQGSDALSSLTKRKEVVKEIIEILKVNGMPDAYGFSNGAFMGENPGEKSLLEMWLRAGHPLGNHTFHHLDLAETSAKDFIDDIARQDQLLAALDHSPQSVSRRRFFRHPFLSEGNTVEKREAVRKYLFKNGYTVAEVTTDYTDWAWDEAFHRCQAQHDENSIRWLKSHIIDGADRKLRSTNVAAERLLHHRIAQILLLHLTPFTATTLGSLLKHWRKEGVQFVSLDEALADPIYRYDPKFVSQGGRCFLDQIAALLGVRVRSEYDNFYSPAYLSGVCKAAPEHPK